MPTERTKPETLGFGFSPSARASYHFVVTIPRAEEGFIQIAEHFVYGEDWEVAAERARLSNDKEPLTFPIRAPQPKVEVSRHKWQLVAEDVRTEFNRQLRKDSLKASAWKVGPNLLSPHLGKELTLLLWAIEDVDPSYIPNAVANWSGLAPEERWWLYTTINAATGHITDGRGRGWRKAIGIAFAENSVAARPYLSQNGVAVYKGKNGAHSNGRNGKGRRVVLDDTEPQLSLLAFEEPIETHA
jgi:hypothetical protein